MKKIFILTMIIVTTAAFSEITAQVMPPGSSDKNLEDRNVKDRSIEIEKIKRDSEKPAGKNAPPVPTATFNFTEIKEDFEKIQTLQNEIIEAYTKGSRIDYAKISGSANGISKSGTRLKENLFAAVVRQEPDSKEAKKSKEKKNETVQTIAAEQNKAVEKPLPSDVKTLIVELDNTIMAFTANPMFTNPKVVSAADNAKANADLERLVKLSGALSQEADKTSKSGK